MSKKKPQQIAGGIVYIFWSQFCFFRWRLRETLKKHNLEVAKPKTLKETLYTNEQVRRVNFTATCKGLAGPEGKC